MEVREQHLAGIKPLVASGKASWGGAMIEEQPADGQPPKLKGSSLVLVAETEAEVREMLEADTYTKHGVWDLEKVQIYPFRTAVRVPL